MHTCKHAHERILKITFYNPLSNQNVQNLHCFSINLKTLYIFKAITLPT